ncbi:MAG: GIY-YIG nuclease family protein, partial [Thiolinea sp.]
MNFEQELSRILQNDPLGLLETKPKASVVSADERLLTAFEEINAFFEQHEREPVVGKNIAERRLAKRLEGLKADPEKALSLKEYDRFNLLGDIQVAPNPVEINNIEDLLGDDPLGLLNGNKSNDESIFQLRNIPENIEMPEKIAKRKPCKDFDKFEALFQACHHDLKSGVKELHEFTGEQQIAPGHFFILHGVMVYVAEVGDKAKKNGKVNARLRCIFENGTESNMLLRSLATELYKDEGGRRVLEPSAELFADTLKVSEEDQQTGYIYILRSLSEDQR